MRLELRGRFHGGSALVDVDCEYEGQEKEATWPLQGKKKVYNNKGNGRFNGHFTTTL